MKNELYSNLGNYIPTVKWYAIQYVLYMLISEEMLISQLPEI